MNLINLTRLTLIGFIVFLQLACSTQTAVYAPVVDGTRIDPIPKSGIHIVKKRESLYSIAWRYGLDHRKLAKRNHFSRPYPLYVGEKIYLKGQPPVQKINIVKKTPSVAPLPREPEPTAPVRIWHWPAKGPVVAGFSNLNKGINIGGHLGDPIFAAAAGKVVYSGNGLRGYGNLIIIEHNRTYMTAYAYNSVLRVKEGQWVTSGQKIADMGYSITQHVMLHFEIRRLGKPLNPLCFLKS